MIDTLSIAQSHIRLVRLGILGLQIYAAESVVL
jgi:hypothetical protein